MKQQELIPMEADFRAALREKYTKPYKKNITVLTTALLVVYLAVMVALYVYSKQTGTLLIGPMIGVTIGFLLVFWMAYPKFKKQNLHYLEDADFGQIIKERTHITKVFDTPVGINIYWLDCDAIKTFTPDPYRIFREGDWVTIYYLKFSKEYLAYEL